MGKVALFIEHKMLQFSAEEESDGFDRIQHNKLTVGRLDYNHFLLDLCCYQMDVCF